MDEYIDRSAVVSALISVENRYNRNRDHENVSAEALYKDLCDAEIEVGKIPAADVAPVTHGRWESHLMPLAYKCSACGYRPSAKEWKFRKRNYCPNCGAKMNQE